MNPLIEQLREKARKATPGPWINDAPGFVAKYWEDGGKSTVCLSALSSIADDFPFIAYANPETVLKLLDAIVVMREALVYVHGQPFNGSWDAQAVYLNGVLRHTKEILK